MLGTVKTQNVLFLDIETIPAAPDFAELNPEMQQLFDQKTKFQRKEHENPALFYERAGIYAEFGKIICISIGKFHKKRNLIKFRLRSYYGDNEPELLKEFSSTLEKLSRDTFLCAHNGKEFDFPYLSRRILINGLPLPRLLNSSGKKPWEVNYLDTMELWKFGDYKNYTSLALLAAVFGIPSPKDDISGSDVAKIYWKNKDLERIKTYCEKDVITVARIFQRFKGESIFKESSIEIA